MSETKQYNENELFEMYDYLLQKEKELEAEASAPETETASEPQTEETSDK